MSTAEQEGREGQGREETLLDAMQQGGTRGELAQQTYVNSMSYLDIMCQVLYQYLQETETGPLPIENPVYTRSTQRKRTYAEEPMFNLY